MDLNLWLSYCLSFLSAGVAGKCHHPWCGWAFSAQFSHPLSAEGTDSSMKSPMKTHCVSDRPHCSSFTFVGCGRASTVPWVSHPCFFVHAWFMPPGSPTQELLPTYVISALECALSSKIAFLSTSSTALFKLTIIFPLRRVKMRVFVVENLDAKCMQRKKYPQFSNLIFLLSAPCSRLSRMPGNPSALF